jgi:hypothetical protein
VGSEIKKGPWRGPLGTIILGQFLRPLAQNCVTSQNVIIIDSSGMGYTLKPLQGKSMSIVTELSDIKRKLVDLEKFGNELRGYL